LVINPDLQPIIHFSSFIGGNDWDNIYDVAPASNGSYYLVGYSKSADFPLKDAYNDTIAGLGDIVVVKISSENEILWSTFLGGSGWDSALSIAVDNQSDCYITGYTNSIDFPTFNAMDSSFNGDQDAFLCKFSSNGSLLYSTFIGGSLNDQGESIAVSQNGSIFISGYTNSVDFPAANGNQSSLQGERDCFVMKFLSNGTMEWSTFWGGNEMDESSGITVDSKENCYITGYTASSNYPVIGNTNRTYCNASDIFISKFSSTGEPIWSAILGGWQDDYGNAIDSTDNNDIIITGASSSTNYPVFNGYQEELAGNESDVIISKFSSNGSLIWSSYFGGSNSDFGTDLSVAKDGCCYLTGGTDSNDFPMKNPFDYSMGGITDAFTVKFDTNGSLCWSSYLGGKTSLDIGLGIAIVENDYCLVVGTTDSDNFPLQNPLDDTKDGLVDGYIVKLEQKKIVVSKKNSVIGLAGLLCFIPIILLRYKKKKK
jgi:hypothetical protein